MLRTNKDREKLFMRNSHCSCPHRNMTNMITYKLEYELMATVITIKSNNKRAALHDLTVYVNTFFAFKWYCFSLCSFLLLLYQNVSKFSSLVPVKRSDRTQQAIQRKIIQLVSTDVMTTILPYNKCNLFPSCRQESGSSCCPHLPLETVNSFFCNRFIDPSIQVVQVMPKIQTSLASPVHACRHHRDDSCFTSLSLIEEARWPKMLKSVLYKCVSEYNFLFQKLKQHENTFYWITGNNISSSQYG